MKSPIDNVARTAALMLAVAVQQGHSLYWPARPHDEPEEGSSPRSGIEDGRRLVFATATNRTNWSGDSEPICPRGR